MTATKLSQPACVPQPARHGASCGICGKAPAGFRASGSSSGNRGGVCRQGYRTRTTRTYHQRGSTPSPSPFGSTRVRTAGRRGRLPTSGLLALADRTLLAIRHQRRSCGPAPAVRPGARVSTTRGSSPRSAGTCWAARSLGDEYPSCARSWLGCAQVSERRASCMRCSALPASVCRRSGMGASAMACRDSAAIHCELNESYIGIAQRRVVGEAPLFTEVASG
jgi:hypothetical protein